MKHIIVGTAGHIDHGKTTLIKALTGRNTDRLKEEQKRGISIELGFTYFDLPSGNRVGIIDVPGHEKFIRNMLAGVVGIDIVMLVVAADEGVMPQTVEHLAIMDLMGIEKGFIVLTKADLVDEEWIELVKEEVREQVKGTFLEKAPIIPVSSIEKKGIDKVVAMIEELSTTVKDKNVDDTPRLPVDRVFSIQGFGTIVTGTLISGAFKVGDEVQIFPGDKLGRIRSLQVHGQDTQVAYAGQRVAINIAGIKKEEVDRGHVVAPKGSLKETSMLDVKVKILDNVEHIIQNRARLRLYIGTKEVLCRIVILDREELNPGEEAYAQLRLEEKIVAKRGDRFILRFYSPMYTIGGGYVLEPNPNKKKRFDPKAIAELKIKERGDSEDIIERIIFDNSKNFPSIKEISISTAMLEDKVKKDVETLAKKDKVILFNLTKDVHVIHKDYFEKVTGEILDYLSSYHKKYPLRTGVLKEEIRSRYLNTAKPLIGEKFIDLLIERGFIEQHKDKIALKDFKVELNNMQLKIKENIIDSFKGKGFIPPKKEEVIESCSDYQQAEEVFNYLVEKGEILKINEEVYMHRDDYEKALILAKDFINKNGQITVAEYRDLLNTNRKVALALLEYFDSLKITRREGNMRKLN